MQLNSIIYFFVLSFLQFNAIIFAKKDYYFYIPIGLTCIHEFIIIFFKQT